ncbi:STAS domain-containing protein [Sutcliffiella deserti]|uniref:STAS domain-containing protein n=1 Tax=Sutcliffiella deserti TaxID=2875501 RepID=UPI001CBFF160|nr:STAS domain-containing protein [Sutcliffiella deserti]
MHRNIALHKFILDKAKILTEEWYESLDKSDPYGVYSSNNPEVIANLKKQNYDFHFHLCNIFVEEETVFFQEFQQWIVTIAKDDQHLNTPIHFTLREFSRVREQYLDFIAEYISINETDKNNEIAWNRLIMKAFDKVILKFVEEHQHYAEQKLKAQQEMIQELSSPIIALDNNRALLPLVGDIDTSRAKFILEHTLEQCSELGVSHLYIDLSGVVIIDTMVADQIYQLISALNLIGVTTTLSGIRPEIAQTTVQLGLSFDKVSIKSTLAGALSINR